MRTCGKAKRNTDSIKAKYRLYQSVVRTVPKRGTDSTKAWYGNDQSVVMLSFQPFYNVPPPFTAYDDGGGAAAIKLQLYSPVGQMLEAFDLL